MPWHVEQGVAGCAGWAVVKDADGSLAGCHPTEQAALEQVAALYAQEPDMAGQQEYACPPGQHRMPDGSCMDDMDMVAALGDDGTPVHGVLAVEGEPTGDRPKRVFAPGSLEWAPTPLALKWQPVEDDGHNGAVIVGRIDEIWRDGALIQFRGVMDDAGVAGAEALRLMGLRMLRGVSLMADDMEDQDVELVYPTPVDMPMMDMPIMPDDEDVVDVEAADDGVEEFHLPGKHNQKDHASSGGPTYDRSKPGSKPAGGGGKKSTPKYDRSTPAGQGGRRKYGLEDMHGMPMMEEPIAEIYHHGRIRSATLLPEPAFVEATVELGEVPMVDVPATMPPPGGATVVTAAAYTITIPEIWPESWFDEPAEAPPIGALHITPQGRVFGYLGPDRVAHRAFRASGRAVTIPRGVDYSEFQNKPCLVAGGDGQVYRINAGNITFDCGHPSPYDGRRADPAWAMQHYDNTCSVAARVRVGENRNGTWVAGGLLHGITADAFERMMACALSGDWQGGRLNAALLVPVEGFPVAQTSSVRVRDDVVVASTVPIRYMPDRPPPDLRPLLERLARSTGRDPASRFAALRNRVQTGR